MYQHTLAGTSSLDATHAVLSRMRVGQRQERAEHRRKTLRVCCQEAQAHQEGQAWDLSELRPQVRLELPLLQAARRAEAQHWEAWQQEGPDQASS